MSHPSDTAHAHDDHGHDDHGAMHFTLGGYVTGFLLSVVLTAIPFWLVMNHVITGSAATAYVILGFAAVQVFVHMVYFLHMNAKSEGGWNMLALIFTLVLLVILFGGSIWVMHEMNVHMMPHMQHVPQMDMG